MQIQIKIDLQGDLLKNPAAAHREIWGAVGLAMDATVQEMVAGVRSFTPIGATGKLAQGIHGDTEKATGMVLGKVMPTMPYAMPAEEGARAHWMPLAPLIYWVQRKLQVPADKAVGVAKAIQVRIAGAARGKPGGTSIHALRTTGRWGWHMFEKGFNERKSRILPIFQIFIGRALRRFGGNP